MKFLFGIFLVAAGWQNASEPPVIVKSAAGGGIVTLGEIRTATVRPGESATVVIPVMIAGGYHVQANPASNEFLVPLELNLQLEPPDSLVSWQPVYPAPALFRLDGTTEDLLTYHGSIEVGVVISASTNARDGKRSLTGILGYQACDNRRCLFPTSVPVTFDVRLQNIAKTEG